MALRSALGRVLAEDIVSPIDVPAHDNSAMDGYALRGATSRDAARRALEVAGTGFAGGRFEGAVRPGQCVRIMTGAVMPAGLDTVVPQEFVRVDGDARRVPRRRRAPAATTGASPARTWRAARSRSPPAALLRPADLGLLASLGRAEVPVFRRLRVAFFSTGDELRSIGEPLDAGLRLRQQPLHALGDAAAARRRRASTWASCATSRRRSRPRSAAPPTRADAVITSGGVSVGEADHTQGR